MRVGPRARALGARVPAPGIAAVGLFLGGCLIVAHLARNVTFSGDDWEFLLHRRGFDVDVFLQPHGEHLSALPILAYKVLLEVFGAGSYAPFMALAIVLHGVVCVLLYVLARRRVGPWVALAPAAILVVLGPAWQDLLWAFQVTYLGSVAAGLGMVLCLERRDSPGDVGAAALLAVSLLCSSIGLGFVAFAAVLLALERPTAWRRLWVAGSPLALYIAWYAAYGYSTARIEQLTDVPRYLGIALSAALASATGLAQTPVNVSPFLVSTTYGRYFAGGVVGLLVLHLLRGRRVPPLAWAASATAIALWTAACLSNSNGQRAPDSSRYQYASVLLVLLAAVSLAEGWRPGRRSGAVLGIATLLVCAANVRMLHQRATVWAENTPYIAAETGAMEVARDLISPNFLPEDAFTVALIGNHNLVDARAGPYLSAVDAFGSAADSPRAILRRPEGARQAADLVLFNAERLSMQPLVGVRSQGAVCRSAQTGAELGEIAVGPGRLAVRVAAGSPTELQLRRFASAYRWVRLGNVPPPFARHRLQDGTTMTVQLPRDRSSLPWHARIVGGRRLQVCVGGAP